MPGNTVRLHRVLRAKLEKVYRAFLDTEAIARWLPPNGFTCKVDQLDAEVGGKFRMSFRNFSTGNGPSFRRFRVAVPAAAEALGLPRSGARGSRTLNPRRDRNVPDGLWTAFSGRAESREDVPALVRLDARDGARDRK